jgi:hypothetical protein
LEALEAKQVSDASTIPTQAKTVEMVIATHPKINESFLEDLKRNGLVVRVQAGVPFPPGYSQINDPIGRIVYVDPKTKMVITYGYWIAPTPAANLINNHLSQGQAKLVDSDEGCVIYWVVFITYYVANEVTTGRTLGKIIVRTKVVMANGIDRAPFYDSPSENADKIHSL